MKKILLLSLVVVLVIIGLPLPVGAAGMAGMSCGDCDEAPLVHASCVAVLVAAGIALWSTTRGWVWRAWPDADAGVYLRFGPDRPPRLA